jgi:HEAT repeat protein
MTCKTQCSAAFVATLLLVSWNALPTVRAAENTPAPPPKEQDLIQVLQSDAPPQDKAITCKKLAIYGSKNAVPALAPLLEDPSLSSWARIALESIPDSAAVDALRNALGKVQGRLLIGVINSVGTRRDPQAVSILAEKLGDTDSGVASAAAEALGRIADAPSRQALEKALTGAQNSARASVAYGCILCAEKLLADGDSASAAGLYDKIRQADVPKQRILEATRGAILARGAQGIPLLLEQLRSPDFALFGIGLRTARELPGPEATKALSEELDAANADRQGPLLLALADRNDAAVLPKLLQEADQGPKALRATALGLLDRFPDLACVPVLLKAATESDAVVAAPAKATLTRFGGKEIDADLLARLRRSNGKTREVLIDLAKQRRMNDALPIALRSTEDSDAGVRRAALEAIGVLGSDQQTGDLVRLLSAAPQQQDREDIEAALLAICSRGRTRCLPQVRSLVQQSDSALRIVGLHALVSIGGPDALGLLKQAIDDSDTTVQDEAVRTLSNWPNTHPDDSGVAEPLLALATSGKKPSYRAQGLQGYLQYIQENKELSNDEKLAKLNTLQSAIKTPEERRSVIAALGSIPTADALQRLIDFAQDPSVVEEACQGLLRIATDRNVRGLPVEVRRKALQTVADKSENDAAKKKAEDALKRVR